MCEMLKKVGVSKKEVGSWRAEDGTQTRNERKGGRNAGGIVEATYWKVCEAILQDCIRNG